MAIEGIHRHPVQGKVITEIKRPSDETVKAFQNCYTAFALDYLGKFSAMHHSISSLSPGMRICGPAVTSLGPDLTVRRMAIDLAQPGDVLVVAAGGVADYACFGDGTVRRMMLKQMAGAIIDGSTRDAGGIRKLGFPTFVKGITPRNYHYPVSAEYGGVNILVICGGVLVNPGDLILGDDDGIVVVPRDEAERLGQVIPESLAREAAERDAMREYEPFNFQEELRRRGYIFE